MSNPIQAPNARGDERDTLHMQEKFGADLEVGFSPEELEVEETSLPSDGEPITPSPQGVRARDF